MHTANLPRKLAAIFHADVAGYSRLSGEDEVGTHRLLSAYLDLMTATITAFGGRTVNFAGDAVLAEFSAVADALACAATVQHELTARNASLPEQRRVQFRIGINLGDVIVDRNDIFGNGVNVAARLETLAEPGGICISNAARLAAGTKLPLDYEDIGAQPVKNIAEPVHAYRVRLRPGAALPAAAALPARRRWLPVTVLLLLLMASGAMLWRFYNATPAAPPDPPLATTTAAPTLPLPTHPSLAVLPFANLSDEPQQEFFVDGLTEDLITDLANLSGLFVISRNSAFTYKDQAVRVQQIARELGVRYVLEGSVRREGDTIRVNAQLIDALNDRHLWAKRYERRLDDVFAVQDALKQEIVAALALELNTGEQAQLLNQPTANIKAYEYYLRGRQALYLLTRRSIRLAYYALEQAVRLDPGFAEAYATLALTYAFDYRGTQYWNDWVRSPASARERALQYAQTAAALAPTLVLPEIVLAHIHLADQQYDAALANADTAVRLAPGDSRVHETQALVLTAAGQHRQALQAMEQALRLDPKPPGHYYSTLGKIHFALHDYASAIENLERSAQDMIAGEVWLHSYYLPAAYAYLGRTTELATFRRKITDAGPLWRGEGFAFSRSDVLMDRFYQRDEDLEHYLEGLRLAGVTEFPFGFEPAHYQDHQISGAALQQLLYGHSFRARSRRLPIPAEFHFSPQGQATWQLRPDIVDTGPTWIENERLCLRFAVITRHRVACYQAFHNTSGDPWGEGYDYILVGPDFYYFSLNE